MRPTTFDTPVQFYENAELVAALRLKARRERRTISEIIRDALRRELAQVA